MTPKQFLEEICAPTVAELENDPASTRRAWVAVVALFHFCDYLAAARAVRLDGVRAEVLREFPRFAWIEEIANAYKHFERNRGRTGLSVTHTNVGKRAAFSDGSFFSDGTSFSDANDVVRMEFGGELVDVVHLCVACLAYLRGKI